MGDHHGCGEIAGPLKQCIEAIVLSQSLEVSLLLMRTICVTRVGF